MPPLHIASDRFCTEAGHRISVQVPLSRVQDVLDAITRVCALTYGDYDCVSFQSALGVQRFRSLPGGRNQPTTEVVQVPCVEISAIVPDRSPILAEVLHAIYAAHPYEEPVICVSDCLRTLQIRGQDEDNPNRFWNRVSEDWVPVAHRGPD